MREHGEWNGCMWCGVERENVVRGLWCGVKREKVVRDMWCGVGRENVVRGLWYGVEREKMVRKKMGELGIEGERWTGEEWVVSESVHGGWPCMLDRVCEHGRFAWT